VGGQVVAMVQQLKANVVQRELQVTRCLEIMHEQSRVLDSLKNKIDHSKTTWLVAGLKDGLDTRYKYSSLPIEYSVIATDGSHIEVDRHQSTQCYLLNISKVMLHYGKYPDAVLENIPRLYAGEENLVISSPDSRRRQQLVEGNLLAARRSVEECRHLAEMALKLPTGSTNLALLDGTLMLWSLDPYPEYVTDILLDKGLLVEFDRIRQAAIDRKIVFGSYISSPRSTDVVNALRIAVCPHEVADCDLFCNTGVHDCSNLAGIIDSQLFINLLGPGERSALFISRSKVVKDHYKEHEILFFYLRVEDEIARIEIPAWVAHDQANIELMHGLIMEQCHKGDGYPVALSEAHEQAVVTASDRENFWQLVESTLIEDHLAIQTTGKSRSKKMRWI
jgi:hypothetical protein